MKSSAKGRESDGEVHSPTDHLEFYHFTPRASQGMRPQTRPSVAQKGYERFRLVNPDFGFADAGLKHRAFA